MKKTNIALIILALIIISGVIYFFGKNKLSEYLNFNNQASDNNEQFSEKCGLKITSVKSGDIVQFPIKIEGIADISRYKELGCNWIRFEGQAGTVQVLANINNSGWFAVTTQIPLMATDWMATTTAVQAELPLVISREIPMGTPLIIKFTEEDVEGSGKFDTLEIPVVYGGISGINNIGNDNSKGSVSVGKSGDNVDVSEPADNSGETMQISAYFHDKSKIQSDCGATYKVTRTIPKTTAVADASLKILFAEDLTELKSFYNNIVIKNKVAIVDFDSGALEYLNNAACMQATFKGPIEDTLLQYPTINKVEYSIDGKVWTEWDA